MRRIEKRAEKAIQAAQTAARCANVNSLDFSDAALTRARGKRAEAERQELMTEVSGGGQAVIAGNMKGGGRGCKGAEELENAQ